MILIFGCRQVHCETKNEMLISTLLPSYAQYTAQQTTTRPCTNKRMYIALNGTAFQLETIKVSTQLPITFDFLLC